MRKDNPSYRSAASQRKLFFLPPRSRKDLTHELSPRSDYRPCQGQWQAALKFAEIARSGGEDYAQIGSKAATLFVDQFKELKPGTVPSFRSDAVTSLLGEVKEPGGLGEQDQGGRRRMAG